MIVGGTGLYIKSLINPIFEGQSKPKLEIHFIKWLKGSHLHEKLRKYDPEYSEKININDTRRIVRAF